MKSPRKTNCMKILKKYRQVMVQAHKMNCPICKKKVILITVDELEVKK